MSTDYYIHIKRKCDNKEIGSFLANRLKNFRDRVEFEGRIHEKFTYEDLDDLWSAVKRDVSKKYGEILEKKLMLMNSKSREVKESFEEDIGYIEEDISELLCELASISAIQGAISAIVEDCLVDGEPAYERNGKDLPIKMVEHGNGRKYESRQYVFNDDVYFEIEANY